MQRSPFAIEDIVVQHKCSLPSFDHPLKLYIQNEHSLRYKFREKFLLSSNNPQTKKYFKSHQTRTQEIHRQVNDKYWYIIHPFSEFRLYWEIFTIFIHYIHLLLLPFLAAYAIDFESFTIFDELSYILSVICSVDIIITMFTGKIKADKSVELNQLIIISSYAKSMLILEILSSIPFQLVIKYLPETYHKNLSRFNFLTLYQLCKIFFWNRIKLYFQRFGEYFNIDFIIIKIINFIFVIITVLHWSACIHQIAAYELELYYKTSLYKLDDILGSDRNNYGVRYLYGLYINVWYFSVTALPDYVHKEIQPYEQVVASIIMILSFVFTVYQIVEILEIIGVKRAASIKYEEIINQVESYIKHKRLPTNLHVHIIKHYKRKYQRHFFNEAAIMNTISEPLRREIILTSAKDFIETIDIFDGISKTVLSKIVSRLKPEIYSPGDLIIKSGTVGNSMYFINSGTVAVFNHSGKELYHLEDGEYFGAISLLMNRKRKANVVAIEFCSVLRLDRVDYLEYIASTPYLAERFEKVAMTNFYSKDGANQLLEENDKETS